MFFPREMGYAVPSKQVVHVRFSNFAPPRECFILQFRKNANAHTVFVVPAVSLIVAKLLRRFKTEGKDESGHGGPPIIRRATQFRTSVEAGPELFQQVRDSPGF
jgi:hypothetical protein